jgi:hypothetical protein
MIHRIVSFYGNDLPIIIPQSQKKVFNFFNIDLIQIPLLDYGSDRHSDAIDQYLNKNKDWDFISIFDVDCIPTNEKCIPLALDNILDENTIYGNAQASNIFDSNIYKSPPFIGASFINFSRKVWEESNCKSFKFTLYPNPEGHIIEADVAEKFVRENEKQGRNIILKYPSKILTNATWGFKGYFNYPEFEYGQATEFESHTFHNFIIRVPSAQSTFIDYCNNLINK